MRKEWGSAGLACSCSRVEKRFDFGGEGGHAVRLWREGCSVERAVGGGEEGERELRG